MQIDYPKEVPFIEASTDFTFDGLITDPLPAKVRKLEERVKVLEDLLWGQIGGQ